MSIKEIEFDQLIDASIDSHVMPVLIGDPGTGKTVYVEEYAKRRNLYLVILIGNAMDPTDLQGMPVRYQNEKGDWVTTWGDTDWAERSWRIHNGESIKIGDGEDGKPLMHEFQGTLVFWDEFNTAPETIQAVQLSVIQSRRLPNNTKLPDTCYFIGAMNDPDVAPNGWELSAPLANRLLHLSWEPSRDEWFEGMSDEWGKEGISETEIVNRNIVVTFIKQHGQFLDNMPSNSEDASKAWPSRRSWNNFVNVISRLGSIQDLSTSMVSLTASGIVGKEATSRLITWLEGFTLPDPSDVLDDPSSIDWKETPADKTFAILQSILSYALGEGRGDDLIDAFVCAAKEGKTDAVAGMVTRISKGVQGHSSIQKRSDMLNTIAGELMPTLQQAGVGPKKGRK